jgi:hypothetical protein
MSGYTIINQTVIFPGSHDHLSHILKLLQPRCGSRVVNFVLARCLKKGQFRNLLSEINSA